MDTFILAVGKAVEKRESLSIVTGNVNCIISVRSSTEVSQKIENRTILSRKYTCGYVGGANKIKISRIYIHTHISVAALFSIVKNMQTAQVSVKGKIENLEYNTHTMK